MSCPRTFNKSIFDSYANLQNFFYRSEAMNQVLSSKDDSYSKALIPLNSNLSGRWLVYQIATAPFRSISAFILNILAKAASFMGATQVSKQAKSWAQHHEAGFAIYSETPTKLFRIKNTANGPNAEAQIVKTTPAIPENLITNSKVKKRTYCYQLQKVDFNHNRGICRGMSFWFLYLYLKTKNQFRDMRNLMAALGKQFTTGGGIDPTLLHSINLRKGKLLGLKIGTQAPRTPESTRLLQCPAHQWESSAQRIALQLQNMPNEAYVIRLPIHTIAYIKIHDQLGYFFDANHGITEINGTHTGEKLYELISQSFEDTGAILHPSVQPFQRVRSNIDVTQVMLR